MFETTATAEVLDAVRAHVFDHHDDVMGADHIDAIKALDRSIRAAQAEQTQQIADLKELRSHQVKLGRGDHSLSVIGELSLARNISPSAAGNQYGFAVGLARLPKVAGVFAAGRISEQAARLVVREATGLDGEQAARFDAELALGLAGLTARKAANLAKHITISIDADAAFERATANRRDRFVSFLPDTDGTALLQARGPAERLLAVYTALEAAATTAKAAGDTRTRGQVMFDGLVEHVTGVTKATGVNVEIGLVMTMGQLLDVDDQPVELPGFGPISATLARRIIRSGGQAFIRRLYTDPIDHSLTDCDQKRRRFDGTLAKVITIRDGRCRQPGCDSPIRHRDHIRAFHTGGPTSLANGQGLCGRSHSIKHLPGWKIKAGRHGDIDWTTPTGHTYTSPRPPVIQYQPRPPGPQRQ